MNRTPPAERPPQRLPRGRFLYREPDESGRYVLYRREGERRLWISARNRGARARAAGPFEPEDAVRALRLANVEIPNGCELGPWQDGLGFFDIAPLAGDPHEWAPVLPASLEASITSYGANDIADTGERACCAPPSYPPKVKWNVDASGGRLGELVRMWNAHPKGALVWAPTGKLGGGFCVADFG